MTIWLHDRLVPPADARVSVFDHGFTVADGVFETLKVVHGVPFAVSRHLRRLHRSAQTLGLQEPDLDLIRHAVMQTVSANEGDALARLRITYTGGTGPLGSDRGDEAPTLVVAMTSMAPWPDTAAVVTVPWARNDKGALRGVKSTSYAENVRALARARQEGAQEALMPDTQGRLSEGTGSNVIVVKDGRAITPTLDTGALPGITRELALEWSALTECDLPIEELSDVQELWLTSSTRDIQAVDRIDGRDLDAPGAVGAAIRARFLAAARMNPDP
jgi:branched-chain amino acid aminotransferase